ncbi:hypothetical protein KSF_086800 [Reticulibacter mediterranei]|uniref:Uncharacterized protein n=1 Tax=Reticulibacter mediterranei TaxID=2778369 RepID=A0A8J3N4V6_9CHLR|nr:hypothetical protein KSF_086800 [Reticulibacter mediterranei]
MRRVLLYLLLGAFGSILLLSNAPTYVRSSALPVQQVQEAGSVALGTSQQTPTTRLIRATMAEPGPPPAPVVCSIFDAGYIDCLIGQASTTIATRLFEAVSPLLHWIEDNPLNFVTRTPDAATYTNPVVQRFVSFGIFVFDAALAVRLLLMAYHVLIGRSIGLPSLTVREALPRLALLVILAHNSLLVCQWLIEFNNSLCQGVDDLFQTSLLRLSIEAIFHSFTGPGAVNLLLLFSLSLFLIVQVFFLLWQMLVRLATVILLTSLTPFAFLSETWLARWISAFVTVVLIQFIQVSALALGGMLAAFFAGNLLQGFSDQLVISLLVSNALFFLVLRVPSMLREFALRPLTAAGETTARATTGIVSRFVAAL